MWTQSYCGGRGRSWTWNQGSTSSSQKEHREIFRKSEYSFLFVIVLAIVVAIFFPNDFSILVYDFNPKHLVILNINFVVDV